MTRGRAYEVLLENRAAKHLSRIDPVIRRRIGKAIDRLKNDPEPPGCIMLTGLPGVMRIRVGDYRIVYIIDDERTQVTVIDIDHRKDIYR